MIIRKPDWKHGTLVALDPGSHKAGIAVFQQGVLSWACAIVKDTKTKGAKGWEEMFAIANDGMLPLTIDVFVFEKMQSYGLRHQKGPQDDLIDLVGMAAYMAGRLDAVVTIDPLPATWKGQVPKEICHKRALDVLSAAEKKNIDLKPASAKLDVLDAVAIGLWALRRT